jgi:hypothetical protein
MNSQAKIEFQKNKNFLRSSYEHSEHNGGASSAPDVSMGSKYVLQLLFCENFQNC